MYRSQRLRAALGVEGVSTMEAIEIAIARLIKRSPSNDERNESSKRAPGV